MTKILLALHEHYINIVLKPIKVSISIKAPI